MPLPAPRTQLAGCIWLPRILTKARLFAAGQLSTDYEARFGHPTGVDGTFLAFFGLKRADIESIGSRSDAEVAAWFKALPSGTPAHIAEWNEIAINLGRPGYPLEGRLPIGLATIYKNVTTPCETVFEMLEADEGIVR